MAYTFFLRHAIGMSLLALLSSQAVAADSEALTQTVAALDAQVFDAYNRCDMDAFSAYFISKVEFYHDQGGVTWDRDAVVANTRKYICGKVRRELLPETLKVYPIKDYGAIEEGEHRFCQIDTGKCEGIARFLMVWEHKDGRWLMTRIVSYGHRSLAPDEKVATH